MDLLTTFKDLILTEGLFTKEDKLLLAVSGGLDSVVLCELCHQSGFDFIIAHANFQLRGEESTRDETFVRNLAAKYNKPVLVKKFDTAAYAEEKKISIQVAARELRYDWFRSIIGRPGVIVGSPDSVIGSPDVIIGSPASIIGSPDVIVGSPASVIGSPDTIVGSPDSVIGSPDIIVGSPANGMASSVTEPIASPSGAPYPAGLSPMVSDSAGLSPVVSDPAGPAPLASSSDSSSLALSPSPRRIVTAHHLDDNIETLLMNFFKGTGIAGMRGILPRQGDLIRPLLFASKDDLRQFAATHLLSWVEDSSNDSDKYTRNYFRHQVIPLVQQVYPEALANLAGNTRRFRDIEILYRQSVDGHKAGLLEFKGNEVHIPALKLKRSQPIHTIVYEIITAYGFSPGQVPEVIALLDSGSGKFIQSATHRILKNRAWLIISPLQIPLSGNILIGSANDRIVYDNGVLTMQYLTVTDPVAYLANATPSITGGPAKTRVAENTAMLDATAIQFPLLLRKWQQGDYFYPLGMRKKKKLARFLIDNKRSLSDKEKTWVIEMDKKIIWIVGMRIDDRFRVTSNTRQILKLESGLT